MVELSVAEFSEFGVGGQHTDSLKGSEGLGSSPNNRDQKEKLLKVQRI